MLILMTTVTSLPFTLCYFIAPLSWEVLDDFENLDTFKLNHFFYDLVSELLYSFLWHLVTVKSDQTYTLLH